MGGRKKRRRSEMPVFHFNVPLFSSAPTPMPEGRRISANVFRNPFFAVCRDVALFFSRRSDGLYLTAAHYCVSTWHLSCCSLSVPRTPIFYLRSPFDPPPPPLYSFSISGARKVMNVAASPSRASCSEDGKKSVFFDRRRSRLLLLLLLLLVSRFPPKPINLDSSSFT